jgi:acetate kinase
MNSETVALILVINIGSSSIKFAVYRMDSMEADEGLILAGKLDQVGLDAGELLVRDPQKNIVIQKSVELSSHQAALTVLLDWLESTRRLHLVRAVGHRVVYGGRELNKPHRVSPDLLETLKTFIPRDPDHLAHEIQAIEFIQRLHPKFVQVACFDSAFHSGKPRVAQLYGLPQALSEQGILRYGFHGLSYEYIVQELAGQAGEVDLPQKVVVAHLGSGASLAAIRNGKSMDTSMGFTATSGIPMSTRSGDIDPGVLLYLLQEKHYSSSQVNELLTKKSGLLGLSDLSSNMQTLLDHEHDNTSAAEAIAVFCYQTKKYIGAYAASLGGLDMLVFTGGIGENASPIRRKVCEGLEFLGVRINDAANNSNAAVISESNSPVTVQVIRTNEELIVARHTRDMLTGTTTIDK